MKIAVINETSAADKNRDILAALEGRGYDIINAGMKKSGAPPELSYIHTSFMSALLLNAGRADFVVGGCGTGQGYLNAVMQYPGVVCGHILTALDAWLFTQINGGNCISLMLNQGYGWASDVNIRFIFDRIFSVERGGGYPEHRREPQRESRLLLERISGIVHLPFHEIVTRLPEDVVMPVLRYPGLLESLGPDSLTDNNLKSALAARLR
ncbi:MAG: RpiB/LacA/LacB family sugar-phosphate isomerase [Spirochaetes bacterium]|nr:RpiB/LacA/LacB family sugar-phosphate isomerase [Spirochaetota bacterium]